MMFLILRLFKNLIIFYYLVQLNSILYKLFNHLFYLINIYFYLRNPSLTHYLKLIIIIDPINFSLYLFYPYFH
jgi:hypothetical protein